jgi:hypothetical protein
MHLLKQSFLTDDECHSLILQMYYHSLCFSGGVTQFAAKENTVAKWVMNRPYQTKFVESLLKLSGMSTTTSNPRKCLRSSEILKSNKMVEKIMVVLRTQFINPSNLILTRMSCSTWYRGIQLQRMYATAYSHLNQEERS